MCIYVRLCLYVGGSGKHRENCMCSVLGLPREFIDGQMIKEALSLLYVSGDGCLYVKDGRSLHHQLNAAFFVLLRILDPTYTFAFTT